MPSPKTSDARSFFSSCDVSCFIESLRLTLSPSDSSALIGARIGDEALTKFGVRVGAPLSWLLSKAGVEGLDSHTGVEADTVGVRGSLFAWLLSLGCNGLDVPR